VVTLRIRQRLALAFMFLSLVPLAFTALVAIPLNQTTLENHVLNHLETVATIHKSRVQELVGDYYERIDHFGHHDVIEHLSLYQQNKSVDVQALVHHGLLQTMQVTGGVEGISILNTSGFVVASTNESEVGYDYSEEAFFLFGRSDREIDIFHVESDDALHSDLAGPIEENGTLLGVVRIDSDVSDLVDLFNDYTGLGWSGEALLAKRNENGDALFVTQLRHRPSELPLNITLPRDDLSAPITQALLGNEDTLTDARDYNDVPVLAATRYIPELDWGIVVKMHVVEAFEKVYETNTMLLLTSLASAILFLIIGLLVMNSLTGPIIRLSEVASRIGKGDFSQRAEPVSDDEISILAQSFNDMADTLIKMNVELERRVEERTAELARSNADLEQFAYVISHDLQEPLRMIVGYLQLIEQRFRNMIDDEADEFIDFAVDGAKRMKEMINDLLAYSRAGRAAGPREAVDLSRTIESVLFNLKRMVDETGARVEFRLLPSVRANRTHMTMLFQNLISNAIKFRREEPSHVMIEALQGNSEWVFSVKDNGIGIDPRYYDRLFKVFQRLHPHGTYEGTGIGLAICRKVVENLGGRIWVESELNKGTTFFFSIPEDRIIR
jgi:signal transduction histidine kinase